MVKLHVIQPLRKNLKSDRLNASGAVDDRTLTMIGSEIEAFFEGQNIFLTGGTGFLGKVLLEKLLRKCRVNRIYLLVRPKKGLSREERFNTFFDLPCFTQVSLENRAKVQMISGDCNLPAMGLSNQDRQLLIQEVTILIHAAANVKFDQTLKEATYNLRAARDVIRLARQMPKLISLVHISTAYSNCILSKVEEKIYEPPLSAEKLLNLVDALDDDILTAITPALLNDWPNTYVYTKCIIEDMLARDCGDLPLTIVRPGIVVSAVKEPLPGWIDNFYGAVGIVFAAAMGVLRSLHADPEAKADLVPVDYVANAVLAATWAVHNEKTPLKIYNYVGNPQRKQLTWGVFMNTVEPYCWHNASTKQVWYFAFKMRKNKLWHTIYVFFFHTCFAYLADLILICIARKPLAVKNYARLDKLMSLISYFSTRSWDFEDGNVRALWNKLNELDRKSFVFDVDHIDWEKYAEDACRGGRLYLLKDPIETLPEGNKRLAKLRLLHYGSLALFWFLIFKLIAFVLSFFW